MSLIFRKLFQNGKPLWRQSGVLSKIEIIEMILEKSTWPELPGKVDSVS